MARGRAERETQIRWTHVSNGDTSFRCIAICVWHPTKTWILSLDVLVRPSSSSQNWKLKHNVCDNTESDILLHDIALGFWKTWRLLANHHTWFLPVRDGCINQTCDHPLLFFTNFWVRYFRNLYQYLLCVGEIPKAWKRKVHRKSEYKNISEECTDVLPVVFKSPIEMITSAFSCVKLHQFLSHHKRGSMRHLSNLMVLSWGCFELTTKSKLSYQDV